MIHHTTEKDTKETHVHSEKSHSEKIHKPDTVNVTAVGAAALIAILFIVWIAIGTNSNLAAKDLSGGASSVIVANENLNSKTLCNIIVSKTLAPDSKSMVVGLEAGATMYYSGYMVAVRAVNSKGCIVDINGNTDYLFTGQIQQIGPLYVTIRSISK